jgi:hypothetical protein
LVILGAGFVSAQNINFNQAFKPFWDFIKYIFVDIQRNASLKVAVFKFVLFLISGSLFLIIVRKLPFLKDADDTAKKRADMLAWFLALGGVFALPTPTVEFMLNEFGMFIAVILGVALPVLLFFQMSNQNPVWRGVGMIVGGIALMIFSIWFGSFLTFAGLIAVIIGVIMLVGGLTHVLPAEAGGGGHAPAGGGGGGHAPGPAAPAGGHQPGPAAPAANDNRVNDILNRMQQLSVEEFAELNQLLQQRYSQRGP